MMSNMQSIPRQFRVYQNAMMNFNREMRRCMGVIVCTTADEFAHPSGTQLLLWDDIDQSEESL